MAINTSIFISYRIADSLTQAGRLHQSLEAALGQGTVFYDKSDLKPGMNWSNEVEEKLLSVEAGVVLALIANSTKWLGVDELGNRRMDNQGDWIRRELEVALADPKKLVIPILLNDADLPPDRSLPDSIKPLVKRQHLRIKESNWDQDMHLLLNTLRSHFEENPAPPTKSLEKGQVVEGIVKNITDFGAYLDLGGISGLLHIDNISWGRINHPSEVLKVNQRIKVLVLKYKKNKNRFELGLKQLNPHSWEMLPADVVEGTVVKGRVVNIQNYGAFAEIMPDVEGLIHISEISWGNTKNINAKEYFKVGQEVEVRVVSIDRADRKISLSIKQLTADPWSDIETRFPVGSRHSGTAKNLTNYGIFVELSEGVGGMVHISDLSWTKRYAHPSEFTKVGMDIDVVVLEVDKDKRRISLGHKQIEENPWDTFETIFPLGSYHEATVLKRNKGAIVQMPHGLEALAPAKHIRKEDGQLVEPGETLMVKVIEFNKETRRILVSHTRYVEDVMHRTEAILNAEKQETEHEADPQSSKAGN